MAKKKTPEQIEQMILENKLKDLRERLHLIPEPTRKVQMGQTVNMGFLKNVKVEEILEEGKIICYSHEAEKDNEKREKNYCTWLDVVATPKATQNFAQKNEMRIQYLQQSIGSILTKAYHFGIDFEPDYQRDYVWTKKDKQELIKSIFENVDIGKFVFVKYGSEKQEQLEYRYMYEILDGKQRTRALLDFFEGRFKYNGYYFQELTKRDQHHFEDYSVSIAEVSELTEEQALRYFLKLNKTGKKMDKKHLESIEKRLGQLQEQH